MGGRCRGVILDLDGILRANFAWGLGVTSNKYAEALALYQGIKIAHLMGIRKLILIRDFVFTISEA